MASSPTMGQSKKKKKAENDLAHHFNLIFRTFSFAVSWGGVALTDSNNRDSCYCFPVQKLVSLPGTGSLAQSCLDKMTANNLETNTSYLSQNQQRRACRCVCMQPVDHPPALRLRLLLSSRLMLNLDWGIYTLSLLPQFPCQPAGKYREICSY